MRLLVAALRPIGAILHRVDQASVPKIVPPPGAPPSEAEIQRICDAHFRYHKYLRDDAGIEAPRDLTDVTDELMDLPRQDPEKLWPILIELVDRAPSDEILYWIAAGPVEDLVAYHGLRFLDRLERRAIQSERFHFALRGIWGWERFPKLVRERLFAVLTPDWDDLRDRRLA